MSGSIKQSWAEVQLRLKNALGTAGGRRGNAQEMLKYSDVNRRIISVEQAQIHAFLDLLYMDFVMNTEEVKDNGSPDYDRAAQHFGWLLDVKQDLEKYQLTMDDPQDARNEFIEVKNAEAKGRAQGKNTLSIETAGSGDSEGGA